MNIEKKQLWNDEKTVSVISSACFHKHQKVQSRAINFFLGQDQKDEDADSSDDEDPEEKRQREKNEEKLPNARDIMVRFAMKKGPRQKKKKAKLMKKLNKKSNKPIKQGIRYHSILQWSVFTWRLSNFTIIYHTPSHS